MEIKTEVISKIASVVELRKLVKKLTSDRNENTDFMTVKEVAAMLKLSEETIRRYIRSRKIDGFKPNGGKKQDRFLITKMSTTLLQEIRRFTTTMVI